MSILVPNKKTYVKRLKAMLAMDGSCGSCPAGPNFECGWLPIKSLRTPEHKAREKLCPLCRDFVDIEKDGLCPCGHFSKKEAITRALQAIEAYEAETHKWCKEKP